MIGIILTCIKVLTKTKNVVGERLERIIGKLGKGCNTATLSLITTKHI